MDQLKAVARHFNLFRDQESRAHCGSGNGDWTGTHVEFAALESVVVDGQAQSGEQKADVISRAHAGIQRADEAAAQHGAGELGRPRRPHVPAAMQEHPKSCGGFIGALGGVAGGATLGGLAAPSMDELLATIGEGTAAGLIVGAVLGVTVGAAFEYLTRRT